MINIGIIGYSGRMAQSLIKEIGNHKDLNLSGYYSRNNSTFNSFKDLCDNSDVIIDFSNPEATMQCLPHIANKTFICGTTGFTIEQISEIKKAAINSKILLSSNMSIGIAILQYALKQIVPLLNDFDVEIIEKHHNKKIDSPSGTALSIAENIAKIKNCDISINRTDIRKKNEIGLTSLRGGTVAGEHIVHFFGNQEIIELSHKAENRDIFSIGAVKLAKILYFQSDYGFFDMEYIINLMQNKL